MENLNFPSIETLVLTSFDFIEVQAESFPVHKGKQKENKRNKQKSE